jgi:hypothetical protein
VDEEALDTLTTMVHKAVFNGTGPPEQGHGSAGVSDGSLAPRAGQTSSRKAAVARTTLKATVASDHPDVVQPR